MLDAAVILQTCAAEVHPTTMAAVVRVESGGNPYAIGVVGGRLARQPRDLVEALATVRALERDGWNFSVGIAQINVAQLRARSISYEAAFDPCVNLRTGAAILRECYSRAAAVGGKARDEQYALRQALSCYYSGNFRRGFQADAQGTSYVERVVANAGVRSASRGAP